MIGQALIIGGVEGVTFTGSYPVGMAIYRQFYRREYIHPVILELGGKNPAIVTKHAELDRAVSGILRSAFGLQGQKCSANSRIYLETQIYDQVLDRLVAQTKKLVIGDPTQRNTYFGPVISEGPFRTIKNISKNYSGQAAWRLGKAAENGCISKRVFR